MQPNPFGRCLLLSLLLLAACSEEATDRHAAPGSPAGDDDIDASFAVRESVGQLDVTHAEAGIELAVIDAAGAQVASGTTDDLGSLIFRHLQPGSGYVISTVGQAPQQRSRKLRVMSVEDSAPTDDLYARQKLAPGFGYIETRDGTKLSIYVTLPGPADKGPYPTVVDYSGYSPSRPGEPIPGTKALCGELPILCDAPDDPSALVAGLFGYATVSVNMRGTGCSGGAYDFFDTLQVLDGYDIIETVAAQDWVLHHKVGMVGLSYPGISQLFVAQTRPPGLAAILPQSVIGNTATTVRPGGILNTGFAVSWVKDVVDRAAPYGQGWEKARADAGDTTCAENQLLHGQKVDNITQATTTEYYDPSSLDRLNPTLFVDQIDVPVFLTSAWQDEQTGPFFSTLLDRFKRSPLLRATLFNGVHVDGFAPQIIAEWKAFLDLYVAQRAPSISAAARSVIPMLAQTVFKESLPLPPDRFAGFTTYEQARAAYEAEPPLRIIFESGGGMTPGAPEGTFERQGDRWPFPETRVLRYYLQPDGSLGETPPVAQTGASSFDLDPDAGQRGILAPGGDIWDPLPAYDYRPLADGLAVAFLSAPLERDLVMVGTGSADLWIRSTVNDADLEINLTEVRPDGKEMYVQSGWLRARMRALGADSTELWPSPTYLEEDAKPLVPGEWTSVRVPIAAFGHVFRAGSRIRVSVDTPGDSRAEWRFDLERFPGKATHSVGHSAVHASSIALPLLEGATAPSPLPACPSLRGQPCRDYVPLANRAAE